MLHSEERCSSGKETGSHTEERCSGIFAYKEHCVNTKQNCSRVRKLDCIIEKLIPAETLAAVEEKFAPVLKNLAPVVKEVAPIVKKVAPVISKVVL